MGDEGPMTPEEAERAHLRGPEGAPDVGHRRMQELRKIGREYPFICPVDFKPHKGSPPGQDPNFDPTFVANHREDDGAPLPGLTDADLRPVRHADAAAPGEDRDRARDRADRPSEQSGPRRDGELHQAVSVLLVGPPLRLGSRGPDDDLQPGARPPSRPGCSPTCRHATWAAGWACATATTPVPTSGKRPIQAEQRACLTRNVWQLWGVSGETRSVDFTVACRSS